MKTPTWVTVIGIIMILFGGCGALNNVQKINSPATLDQMSGAFDEISQEIEKEMNQEFSQEDSTFTADQDITVSEQEENTSGRVEIEVSRDSGRTNVEFAERDSAGMAAIESMFGSLDKVLVFSDYYKTWIVRLGIIGLIASIFYFIAGLLLIMGKSISLNLTYGAIAISLCSVIFQIVIISLDKESGFAAKTGNFTNYFMLLVNIILIVIVLASDKSYFHQFNIEQE